MTATPLILALDFGGTKHAAALTRAGEREWLARVRRESPPGANAETDIAIVLDLARELRDAHPTPPSAVGVSFGGPVDAPDGVVRLSHHVPGWEAFPLAQSLRKVFGVPVTVDNDANAGALGEWRYGAGRGVDSLLYITVSTGVGGGWVIDGKPYRGADGMAGEIGHTVVRPQDPHRCVCGRYGCVEILACGPAIARNARERLKAEPGRGATMLEMAGGDPGLINAALVSRAADSGDELAMAALLDAANALGTGIGNALSLMNPARVVLGGGVTQAGERYWAEVRRAARANTLPEISVDIVPAELGGDAPLWGAAVLAEGLLNL